MGVVLDPGRSPEVNPSSHGSNVGGALILTLVIASVGFGFSLLGTIVAGPNSIPGFLAVLFGMFSATSGILILGRTMNSKLTDTSPKDMVRSSLNFTPVDGREAKVGHFGGGGTHIVRGGMGGKSYVVVIADNGMGFSEYFDSNAEARRWAEGVVARPQTLVLHREILFDDITEVRIVEPHVDVSSSWKTLHLSGWFGFVRGPHQAQVRHLIKTLGFTEDANKPGVYADHVQDTRSKES